MWPIEQIPQKHCGVGHYVSDGKALTLLPSLPLAFIPPSTFFSLVPTDATKLKTMSSVLMMLRSFGLLLVNNSV